MRIVLDTNVLVRAAADDQGLAGRLLQKIASGPYVLVSSPYILSEIARVLAYARLQARWRLTEKTVREFVSRVPDHAPTSPGRLS
jgi:putative PIN family toxin of toxin-antitoxin system